MLLQTSIISIVPAGASVPGSSVVTGSSVKNAGEVGEAGGNTCSSTKDAGEVGDTPSSSFSGTVLKMTLYFLFKSAVSVPTSSSSYSLSFSLSPYF